MLKVLIVEDEELIRRGIVLTVDWEALGCHVIAEAANGEEALKAVAEHSPDLIVTDLKMPVMDGIRMLEKLRQDGYWMPVIILTAYDTFDYARSALRLGAVDYLLKPFHDGDLENAVQLAKQKIVKPDSSSAVSETKKAGKSKYVQETLTYIDMHYNDPDICVGSIAGYLNISEGHLSHIFKKETGYTILSYLTRHRIQQAKFLLKDCRIKVYEVAQKVGYRDIAYFSSTFKKQVGISPSEYQDSL
jgi:two-component system response regulator YesN